MTIENSTLLPAANAVNPSPNSASLQTSVASDASGFTDALTTQLNNLNGNNAAITAPQIEPLPLLQTGQAVAATPEIVNTAQGATTPANVEINTQTGKILPQDASAQPDESAQQALEAVLQFLYPSATQSAGTANSTSDPAENEPVEHKLTSESEHNTTDESTVDPSTILPLPISNITPPPQTESLNLSSSDTLPQTAPLISGQNPASAQVIPQASDKANAEDQTVNLGLTNVLGDQSTADDKAAAFSDVIKQAFDNQQNNTDALNTDAITAKDSGQYVTTGHALFSKGVEHSVSNPAGNQPAAIKAEISHPEWQSELGDRILWLNNKSIPSAEIQLNPEHLGPISIKIDLNHDQASIAFTAQHAAVREALEASIPKLKELFNDQQLNLGQVNISQQFSPGQGQQQSLHQQQANSFTGQLTGEAQGKNPAQVVENPVQQALVSKGLLSLYA